MPDTSTPFDPTTGSTPATPPTQDPCCQSPCDPAWRTKSTCVTFNETRTVTLPIGDADTVATFARGRIVVNVTYAHTLCLLGKQHGGLAYTLTLLPGEKMILYQSTVPTDGVVYDPELAHCCAQDPELELADRIRLEREQAEAQCIGLQVQLMALEVQRRQALLAAGTLTPFEPAPAEA